MEYDEVADAVAWAFADAWNRHDMEDFGRLFHESASFVNVRGMQMQGRESIQAQHASIHAGVYRDSALVVRVEDSAELAAGVVVSHGRFDLSGDARPPGQIRPTLLTLVITRADDAWKIAAAHNTEIAPPPP